MGSRIRENVRYLYECFCEVSPGDNGQEPYIIRKYPDSYNSEEELKHLPKFTFPCEFENQLIQHYSFVLTSMDSKYTFCFCRYDPKTKTSLVILSHVPWHDIFYKLLNCIAILLHSGDKNELLSFLDACRIRPPMPGHTLKITYNAGHSIFTCECPDKQLPRIPGNCNLTEYYNALDPKCMVGLWAALLHERRVAVVASKPSRLSATVQAANITLYPMSWQHIFIPILPKHLVDYLLAPMPFLIGVPRSVMETVKLSDIGDVVILDADSNVLKTPFNDLETLPTDVVSNLKKSLSDKSVLAQHQSTDAVSTDAVSRAFLRALVCLIGGYMDAIRIEKGKLITFNEEAFIRTRKNMPFLSKILQSQIFRQFIEERLELLNCGRGYNDEFEAECCSYAERAHGGSGQRFKQQYRDWAKTMKREGGAFFKTVKDKTNPAVRSAVKSVRQGGRNVKSAVKGFKMRMPKHGSRPSSVSATDDGRFSYGSATPASSGSSTSLNSAGSSQSAPQSPPPTLPPLPLDLLNEMESMFSSQRSCTMSAHDQMKLTQASAEKSRTLSPRVPPRLLERPSIPARYPIVPTRNLVDLSDAPLPPPRTGNIARGKAQFVSHITKNESNGLSVFHTTPIHFTEVANDHTKLKATTSVNHRKLSLTTASRNGDALKATLPNPDASTTTGSTLGPITNFATNNNGNQRREASDSGSDLIQLDVEDSSPKLEDFDPLKCSVKTDKSFDSKRAADSDLLQEYGLDFSRFTFTDNLNTGSSSNMFAAQSKSSVPKGWTTFQ